MSQRQSGSSTELEELWNKIWPMKSRQVGPNSRRLELTVENVKATVGLLEDAAPRTCRAFWKVLPIEGHVIHAAWSGDMVRLLGQVIIRFRGLENDTIYPSPGDVCYCPQENELSIGYGDAEARMPYGNVRLSVFGCVLDNWENLARMCRLTRLEGAKRILITRQTDR